MGTWLPIPTWDNLHPIITHFPIALLLVAPLFVFLGLIHPRKLWLFSVSALLLMLVGTIGAYVAVESGEAAAQLADRTPEINAAIAAHQDMAEKTRLIFTILTALYALFVAAPLVLKHLNPRRISILQLIFMLVYLGACLILARTGHLGGRLVHSFGVHAMMSDDTPSPAPATTEAPAPQANDQVTSATQ